MRASRNALDLIKKFESCRLQAYEDTNGWAVGYGSTGPGITERTVISQGVAEALLKSDVGVIEQHLSPLVNLHVNQDEYDALTSLAYNVGITAIAKSTLIKKIKAGDKQGAAEEFLKWDHSNGKVLEGLSKRREAEMNLFLGKRST